MNAFTYIWLALFASGLTVEAIAFFTGKHHGTLTWTIRHFVTGLYNPHFPRWIAITNRGLLLALFTWLYGHFALGWGP